MEVKKKENLNTVFRCSLFVIIWLCRFAYAEQQITRFGITWMFDRDYTTGQFANGDYWVVGPVTIISIIPPSVEIEGRLINGSMVNPSPKLGVTQGYDSAMYSGYAKPEYYDPALNSARPHGKSLSASNPLVLQPHSSLVSTISTPDAGGKTQLQTAAILTVLSDPAPADSFRPPYTGTDKTIKFNKDQLNYSFLANLQSVPGTPRLATVERYFERPWLEHCPGWMGRFHHSVENMPHYDRDVCTQVGVGALMLHLGFINPVKETLLVRYTQLGIDLYGVIQEGGKDNWLQDSGRKYPILFAGLVLDDSSMKNIGAVDDPADPNYLQFEEDIKTFYVTQMDVDLTHGPQWNPDRRDAMRLPYEQEDLGLPEWAKVTLNDRVKINKCWDAVYRTVIGQSWGGFVLATHIMGAQDWWNHDALFDYKDRYMQVELELRESSRFVENMWDAYRPHYGPVWTLLPSLNVTAIGGSVTKTPAKRAYILGEIVVLKAVADPGYTFSDWSGVPDKNRNPITVVMHANRSVTAHFTPASAQ